MEVLEHEPDASPPQARSLRIAHAGNIGTVEFVATRRRLVEQPEDMEQSRLART
jgi:hypothetical protein